MRGWRILVVGGGSVVIQEVLDRISEKQIPLDKLMLFSIGNRIGEIHELLKEPILVGDLNNIPESDYDIALFLSHFEKMDALIGNLIRNKIKVIDATGFIPAVSQVPVLFPEYPPFGKPELPVVSILPHYVSIVVGLICKPLEMENNIESVKVFATQSVSQTGSRSGMDELFHQMQSILSFQEITHEEFEKQIAYNILPAKAEILEKRIKSELKSFLNAPDLEFQLELDWGGFFVGVIGTVLIQLRRPLDFTYVRNALNGAPSIQLLEDGRQIGILDSVGNNNIVLSSLRMASESGKSLTVRFTMDNLLKGLSLHLIQLLQQLNQ